MTPRDLIAAFEKVAEAPDGVKRLRELVLQLAVRGKLVPQDPEDEPASVLLERIANEKDAEPLAKHARPVLATDRPFDAPDGWEWSLVGGLCHVERGGSPRPIKDFLTDDPNGLNWIKIGDTDIGGKYIVSAKQRIRKEGLKKTRRVFPGDFLLTNSMSFGRPYITKIAGCIHDGWLRIHPPTHLNKDFLYTVFSSPYIVAQFKAKASGAVVMNLNADKVRDVPVPLPPLAEQHRIVARVDELMSLLDRLEAARNARDATREATRDAVLAALSEAETAEDMELAWTRFAERIDDLVRHPDDIKPLRQAVLELAVRGQLVQQDSRDEPASELLGERVLANDRHSPTGWSWVSIRSLGDIKGGGTPSKREHTFWDGNVPWVCPKDMKRDFIGESILSVTTLAVEASSVKLIPSPALLMVVRGMILAHSFPVALTTATVTVNQDMKALIPFDTRIAPWLLLASKALKRVVLGLVQRSTHGTCKLKSEDLFALACPMPPLAEQHRIVARVDEVMSLLDRLESQLNAAHTTHAAFASAAVHHLDA